MKIDDPFIDVLTDFRDLYGNFDITVGFDHATKENKFPALLQKQEEPNNFYIVLSYEESVEESVKRLVLFLMTIGEKLVPGKTAQMILQQLQDRVSFTKRKSNWLNIANLEAIGEYRAE
jgi:hypothetical protein